MKPFDSPEKFVIDALSVMAVTGALVNMLPAIAAVFTIVWTGIRIWETETVQGWAKRKVKGEDDG